MRGLATIIAALGLVACGRSVCPLPAVDAAPGAGDANGDGRLDISDGLLVERWLFAGGAAPVCESAVDASADGLVDAGDGVALWTAAFAGGALPEPTGCAAPGPAEAACARVDVDLQVEDRAATVRLRSRDLAIEGWQLSVVASGCAITGGSVTEILGANLGYGRVDLSAQGAVSAVALSWLDAASLPADGQWREVLQLELSPTEGEKCRLSLEDGQVGAGRPVDNLVSAGGLSYPLLD